MRSRNSTVHQAGLIAVLVTSLALLGGCNRATGSGTETAGGDKSQKESTKQGAKDGLKEGKAAAPTLLVSSEDVLTVRSNALSLGPSITGSVQPERRADLRAEVAAVVVSVAKENGDPVHKGDLLVRLDDTSIRDTLTSAEASARAADQAFEQAQRQYERLVKLRENSLVSTQQVEDAEIRRNTSQSDRESARARVVSARQQLERTQVRAPFDGIISDRKVSNGDTAQVGKELLKVIDPHSLRFEGLVSADSIGDVHAGQRVSFRVHGFAEREFEGTIARVNPAANSTTRQVEVLVNFTDVKQQPEVAGLYAEGRIETHRTAALTIPASALVREGDSSFAWRVKDNVLQKVTLRIGDRDARSGDFVLQSGLAEGDTLLRYPSTVLQDGQQVDLAPRTGASPVVADRAQLPTDR